MTLTRGETSDVYIKSQEKPPTQTGLSPPPVRPVTYCSNNKENISSSLDKKKVSCIDIICRIYKNERFILVQKSILLCTFENCGGEHICKPLLHR